VVQTRECEPLCPVTRDIGVRRDQRLERAERRFEVRAVALAVDGRREARRGVAPRPNAADRRSGRENRVTAPRPPPSRSGSAPYALPVSSKAIGVAVHLIEPRYQRLDLILDLLTSFGCGIGVRSLSHRGCSLRWVRAAGEVTTLAAARIL
jgi:hypothetical protein